MPKPYTTYSGSWPETRRQFGYTWKLCPYSTNYFLPQGAPSWKVAMPGRTVHTTTSGRMAVHNRGGTWGWMCFDDNCAYFIDTGQRYFQI